MQDKDYNRNYYKYLHFLPSQEPMENHWVVITGITDEIVQGKRKVTLTVASWGMRFTLDFRDVYDYSSYWGLMYFTW